MASTRDRGETDGRSCGEANAGAGGNVRAREMKVTMTRGMLDGLGDAAEEIASGGGAGGETLGVGGGGGGAAGGDGG